MDAGPGKSRAGNFLISAAAFVIVVAGMRYASGILVPVLLSLFIAIICTPPLLWLKAKKLPTGIALLVMFLAVGLAGLVVVMVVGSSVDEFTRQLPNYQERLQGMITKAGSLLTRFGVDNPGNALAEYLNARTVTNLISKLMGGLSQLFTNALFILLTVLFMLLEAAGFENKLLLAMGRSAEAMSRFEEVVNKIKRYMAIKTGLSLVTGGLVGLWLWVLGVDYPVMWGLVAFLFNFVPNIGSIIAAVPALILALIQAGPDTALLTALGYLVVNFAIGSFVEPKMMGRGVGLSSLVVFLSLVFWGWVLGLVGMVLSVPLTMAVRIALDSMPGTRGIAVILGPDVQTPPIDANLQRPTTVKSE